MTPKGVTELTAEERLLHAIFGEKLVKFAILHYVCHTVQVVLDVKVFNREEGDDTLSPGVKPISKSLYRSKRKIHVGDKMWSSR